MYHELTEIWWKGDDLTKPEMDKKICEWLEEKCRTDKLIKYGSGGMREHFGLTPDPVEKLKNKLFDIFYSTLKECHPSKDAAEFAWNNVAKEAIKWMENKK